MYIYIDIHMYIYIYILHIAYCINLHRFASETSCFRYRVKKGDCLRAIIYRKDPGCSTALDSSILTFPTVSLDEHSQMCIILLVQI